MKKILITDSQFVTEINSKIDEIAECLRNKHNATPGLMNGKVGEVLFWAYYSSYMKKSFSEERVVSLLAEVFDDIKNGFKYQTFANGLAGVGWTVEHLAQNGFINTDTNKIIGSLDDFLLPYMLDYINEDNYDYLHGALGIGLYYLNRKSNSKTHDYLIKLVDLLGGRSIRLFEGSTAWKTKLMQDSDLSGYDLSLSHGISSVIAVLSRIYEVGIHKNKVSELVNGSVDYLLKNKQDAEEYIYQFPAWVCENDSKSGHGGRLAWCYNDLGISLALWQAGYIFGNELWKKEAVETLLLTTRLTDIKETGVHDVGFCHGAAGIAHIYHRMYYYTGLSKFKESAIFWFSQSLKMSTFKDGLAGYKVYRATEFGGSVNVYGLLTGIAGIGLAMISAVSDIKPKWDECLLLS